MKFSIQTTVSICGLLLCLERSAARIRQEPIVPVLQGPYGNDLRQCKDNWASVSAVPARFTECMSKLLFSLIPKVSSSEGIPELEIPSLNPLRVPSGSMGEGVMRGEFRDATTHNITKAITPENARFTYDPKQRLLQMDCQAKGLYTTSKYSLTLSLGSLFPGQASTGVQDRLSTGSLWIVCDLKYVIKMTMREMKNRGLAISKAEATLLDVTNMRAKFTPDTPEDPVANLLNAVTSGDAGSTVIKEAMAGTFGKMIAKLIGSIFHQAWQKLDKI